MQIEAPDLRLPSDLNSPDWFLPSRAAESLDPDPALLAALHDALRQRPAGQEVPIGRWGKAKISAETAPAEREKEGSAAPVNRLIWEMGCFGLGFSLGLPFGWIGAFYAGFIAYIWSLIRYSKYGTH